MNTIEQAAELHAAIDRNAPHPGAVEQFITPLTTWAGNQAAHGLVFTSRIAPRDMVGEEREAFLQGRGCVEVRITARWGGRHHDGAPRTGTDVDIHVLDRLAGGMAQRSWHTAGLACAEPIAPDAVIDLVRSLLGMESRAAVQARKDAEQQQAAAEKAEWLAAFGLGA